MLNPYIIPTSFIAAFLLFFAVSVIPQHVDAATRTWDGGGGVDTNWSTAANWSSDTIPTSADAVVFDNTSDKNATVDAGFAGVVASISINAGYDGTISLQRSLQTTGAFTQSAGVFIAADQALNVDGVFTLNSGADFTASSSTSFIGSFFTINSGAAFNHNNGTVTMDGVTATWSCNNVLFNHVVLGGNNTVKTISSNCSLPLGHNPAPASPVGIVLNGTLSGSGILDLKLQSSNITLNAGAQLLGFDGITTTNLTISGATVDFSEYNPVILRNNFVLNSGVFTAPALMTVGVPGSTGANFTNNGGIFNHNNGTVVLDRDNAQRFFGNTIFYNLIKILTPTSSTVNPSLIFTAGTTQTIVNSLVLEGQGVSMSLVSSTPGTRWTIDAQGTRQLNNVNVQDSNNLNSLVVSGNNLTDLGNNVGWIFTNNTGTPTININTPPEHIGEGRRKLTGTIKTDDYRFDISKVEASVNGGGFSRVTNLSPSVQQPHGDKYRTADFYHEFEPWHNNNGDINKWKADFDSENASVGYTISIKAYNINTDKTEHAFYFTPFILTNTGSDQAPQINVTVNEKQQHILKENLSHYRLSIKPANSGWYIAANNIPISDDDNKHEDDSVSVIYSENHSKLTVTPKIQLGSVYEARIEAVDKAGHVKKTNAISIGTNYYQNANNLSITTEWFPLQINRISATSTPILSTINRAGITASYRAGSLTPTFFGIAFANSTVTLTVVNGDNQEQQRTYKAKTTPRSTWTLIPTLYSKSQLYFAVEDLHGRYNQLSMFALYR